MIKLKRVNILKSCNISQENKKIAMGKWEEYYNNNKKYYEEVLFKDIVPIIDLFNKYNIQLGIHQGTALSLYRENRFFPWDTDIDFFLM